MGSARRVASGPIAIYRVSFARPARASVPATVPPPPLPRVTRMLVLAYRIDDMIRTGDLRDWADAARLLGVTRARTTQIAGLLLLAPEIQEAILSLHGNVQITERCLRPLASLPFWRSQREQRQSPETALAPRP